VFAVEAEAVTACAPPWPVVVAAAVVVVVTGFAIGVTIRPFKKVEQS
jgi:hypothetical protein